MRNLDIRRSDVLLSTIVAWIVSMGGMLANNGRLEDVPGYALTFGCVALLLARRRFPVTSTVLITLGTALHYIGPFQDGTQLITIAVAIFLAGANGHRVAALAGAGLAMAVFTSAELIGHPQWGRPAGVLGWLLVVIVAGEVARYHRAWMREAAERAAEAERTREEEARRRATEERLRIARELHDVLAHNISLINVQAGAALHRRSPEQAYAALEAIKDASKTTLRELRTTLGVLRQVDEAQPRDPAPSVADLDTLVKATRDAGLAVSLEISGTPVPLPAPVDLTAYRIVQEALTNAVRHAGSSTAAVRVGYAGDTVTVEISDQGECDGYQEGNGIRGMRERAASVNGTLVAEGGPTGFRVHAALPLTDPTEMG